MQTVFGLVPHVNLASLTGQAVPMTWRVDDADTNPFAVGDVVTDSLRSVGGVPVVTLYGGKPRQSTAPLDRVSSLLQSTSNSFGVIVGVAPASFLDPNQPVIAAGGGSGRFVWVLQAAMHVFDIRGDTTAPARRELQYATSIPFPGPTEQGVNDGMTTASLIYAPPVGPGSGVRLQGSSFSDQGRGELAVLGLAPGMRLGPSALYSVRLRAQSSGGFTSLGQTFPGPYGM